MPHLIAAAIVVALAAILIVKRLRNPHALARAGETERLARLIAGRPELIESRDAGGETPLMHAAKYNERPALDALLRSGADPNAVCHGNGTALMSAAACGCPSTVEALVEAEARLDAADDQGVTALHYAALGGRTEIVRLLLHAGARTDPRDAAGRTAAEVAAERGFEAVAELIAGGAQHAAAADERRARGARKQ